MEAQFLSKSESKKAWNSWQASHDLPEINGDYATMRSDIEAIYNRLKADGYSAYDLDARFGVELYHYIGAKGLATLRNMADDGFWRYLTLIVFPHLTGDRWGNDNMDHYFHLPNRNWAKSLWWYVYLYWQGTEDETLEYITSKEFSTDTVQALVERSGHFGTNVELYRAIMTAYKHCSLRGQKYFRKIMIMNTLLSTVVEPGLCTDGINGYVNTLIDKVGIR